MFTFLKTFYLHIHISEKTNWIHTSLLNISTSATGHHWDVGEWKAWSRDVMYTHKKAHKWVWRDWWDFKKLLEGISLGLFPTAPQCQSQSRRKDGRRKGRKKKHNHGSRIAQDKPFHLQPWSRSMGCKKMLSSLHLQERETSLPLQKYPFGALSACVCLDEQVQFLCHS